MSQLKSIRSVLFDIHNVLMTHDSAASFSSYLNEKAKNDPRIDTFWSGDVRGVLQGFLTKYCPLCEHGLCRVYAIDKPGRHVRCAVDEGKLTYEGFKVAITYMLTHHVQCDPKVRIVLDHAADFYTRPDLLMQNAKPLAAGIALFHRAVERYGRERVFLFSNMPPEAFAIYKRVFVEVVGAIPEQNAIIAGHLGVAKPKGEAFKSVIERVGGEPSTMLFIDDLAGNIKAAQAEGMQAILFRHDSSPELAAWQKEMGFVFDK